MQSRSSLKFFFFSTFLGKNQRSNGCGKVGRDALGAQLQQLFSHILDYYENNMFHKSKFYGHCCAKLNFLQRKQQLCHHFIYRRTQLQLLLLERHSQSSLSSSLIASNKGVKIGRRKLANFLKRMVTTKEIALITDTDDDDFTDNSKTFYSSATATTTNQIDEQLLETLVVLS